jgi:putative radical SAM enzyme (TIGR03279 family)
MNESDIDRIIKYRVSPINISLHTTDEEIRCKMLNNKNAGKVLKYIDKLCEAKIDMNLQIVLCKGINDKEVLYKTLSDVTKYMPMIKSISIVPVGISKHRDNLFKLYPLEKEDCLDVILNVSKFQKEFKSKFGTNLVYLSDEFYLKAGVPIPKYKEYEDFAQLENGVGMIAVFEDEFKKEISKLKRKLIKIKETNTKQRICKKNIIILTGKITYNFIKEKSRIMEELLDNISIDVRYVENNYFGTDITVTGLMTGSDILETIKNVDNNMTIMIPDVCLKEDEDIFLDDIKLTDLRLKYNNIVISENNAKGFVNSIYKISK